MTLAQDIIDDIDRVVLNTDDFGVAATLRCQGYASAAITVIFSEPAAVVNPISGEVETTAPEAWGKSTDLVNVSQGDILEIGADRYAILGGPEPDGFGMARILLSRSDL